MDWTSAEDKQLFKTLTKDAGVLIMGQNTYDTIGKPLPERLTIVLSQETRVDQPGILEHRSGDLTDLLLSLKDRGFQNVIIAGGTFVNSSFLKEGLIDEIQITIEPKIFGEGLRLFDKTPVDVNLELLDMKKLNDNSVHLTYKVKK